MIFIDNKYTKWYFNIINNSKSRVTTDYTEEHHIIPDCFFINRTRNGPPGWLPGNPEDESNKANLTAEEHFVCHLLLTKMVTGKPKYQMLQAATAFTRWASKNHQRQNVKINSKTYARLKKQKSEALKELWSEDDEYRTSALSGWEGQWENEEHIEKMSKLRKDLWKDEEYLKKMKKRPRTFKKVVINGVIYDSLISAGQALGVSANYVSKKCTSPKVTDWNYLN